MSAVYGIAGFVDGFVNGRGIKNAWEDRKLDRERQKKLDDIIAAKDARDAEEHARRMRTYDQASTDWETSHADQEAYRKAQQEAIDAADGYGVEPPAGPAQTSVSTSSAKDAPSQQVAGVAAALGMPMGAAPDRMAESYVQPDFTKGDTAPVTARRAEASPAFERSGRAPGFGATPPQSTDGPAFERGGRSAQPQMPAPQAAQNAARALSPAISDELYQNGAIGPVMQRSPQETAAVTGVPQGIPSPTDGIPGMSGIERRYAPDRMTNMAPDPNYSFGTGLVPDAAEAAKRGVGYLATGIQQDARAAANAVNSTINPALRYVTGGAVEAPEFTGNGWETNTKAQRDAAVGAQAVDGLAKSYDAAIQPTAPMPPNKNSPLKANVPASAPAATKDLAQTAVDAMAAVNTPDVQAASEAAAATTPPAMGVKPGDKVTEDQRKRGAKAWMDRYMEVGAPIVMKEMLKRGDFTGAQKFQEFLDMETTRAGMENWARAGMAASIGDFETAGDELITAYNRLDYFPDGTTIVKDQSGFTFGKDGQPNGAKITFRDEKTGNTWEQVIQNPHDFMRMGLDLLSPQEVFKHHLAQDEAATAAAAKATVDPAEAQKVLEKRIDDAAKIIFEKTVDQMGNPTLTYAEARNQAEAILTQQQGGQTQGPPAPPPIAYRPTN